MNIKTFYIETLGCKVNQYESQVIREGLLRKGYIEAVCSNEADICVINTCTVTSTSDSKSLRLIRNAVKKDRCVIATGCMVEDRALDLSSISGARFIIKNKDKYRIPEIINNQQQRSDKSKRARFGITSFKGHTRVFVKIQDGCDNTCSYCKVRVVRGHSRSRPFKEVMDECTHLVRNGSKEIVLTGICLGDYGKDLRHGTDLCKLLKEICRIEGDWRLRLSSIEPKDITEGLIQELGSQERLCKHLHIPFQSGDDDILKRMKRPYTRRAYLDTIKRLRDKVADIAISTDIMVGFPGETEKRFRNTLDFVKTINPMRVHVFPFSKRRGTEAYIYGGGISSIVKKERRDRLLVLARGLSREFVERFVDKKVRILVEEKRSREGYLQGYTERYIKVFIDGPADLKGGLLNFRLTLTNSKPCGILFLYFILIPVLIYASYKVQLG